MSWICLSALFLAGIPPFLPLAALPQVFVPILPSGGLLDFYDAPQLFVLGLELFRRRLSGAVRIQAQDNLLDGGVVSQISVQGSFIQAAQGDGVAGNLPVQGEVAHQVDGRLEHKHPIQVRSAGEAESNALITAGHVPLKAGSIQIICSSLIGESGYSAGVSAYKDTVVVQGILIQQASTQKGADHLRRNPSFLKIGKYPSVIRACGGKRERKAFSLWSGLWRWSGWCIPGPSMVGQQALHRLLETLAAEPLEECNGIPSGLVRVAKPCAAIPDAEAVHLLGGMIVSDPMDMIAEGLQ